MGDLSSSPIRQYRSTGPFGRIWQNRLFWRMKKFISLQRSQDLPKSVLQLPSFRHDWHSRTTWSVQEQWFPEETIVLNEQRTWRANWKKALATGQVRQRRRVLHPHAPVREASKQLNGPLNRVEPNIQPFGYFSNRSSGMHCEEFFDVVEPLPAEVCAFSQLVDQVSGNKCSFVYFFIC